MRQYVTLGSAQAFVNRIDDTFIRLTDPVQFRIFQRSQHGNRVIRRTAILDQDLNRSVGLPQTRSQCFSDKLALIEAWNHNRNKTAARSRKTSSKGDKMVKWPTIISFLTQCDYRGYHFVSCAVAQPALPRPA